nr:alpha/beta hydrolase fold domain-containing protein [Streptococcus sobrinus]
MHGGGFVAGSIDLDNTRCIALAEAVPAVVVAVEYRLSGKNGVAFPQPLEDCYAAYDFLRKNADEFGADPDKIGLHGSSAGGTLAEGLALYIRDKGLKQPALTVLNCPTFDTAIEETFSFHQMIDLKMGPEQKSLGAEATFLGGYNGHQPSYYAFPNLCHDVGGLGATMIIMAEYDTLRDTAYHYSQRLLNAGVSCEVLLAGRMAHTFTSTPYPYTDFVHEYMAWSFKREFGMLDDLKKD